MTARTAPVSPKPAERDALARELERLLGTLTAEHERLRLSTAARRAALSRADLHALSACTAEENDAVQRIATLDKERAGLALIAARRFGEPGSGGATLSWIASRLPGTEGARLAGLASRLRELIGAVRHERAAVAQAAETLALHMRGILRAVEQRLSGGASYSRTGAAPIAGVALSALDLTS